MTPLYRKHRILSIQKNSNSVICQFFLTDFPCLLYSKQEKEAHFCEVCPPYGIVFKSLFALLESQGNGGRIANLGRADFGTRRCNRRGLYRGPSTLRAFLRGRSDGARSGTRAYPRLSKRKGQFALFRHYGNNLRLCDNDAFGRNAWLNEKRGFRNRCPFLCLY